MQAPQQELRNSSKRNLIYLTSLLAQSSFLGLIGSYAMVKHSLAEEVNIEEGQLGILDGANFFTRSLTIIYLTFKPLTHPKRAYAFHSSFVVAWMVLIPLTPYLGSFTYPALILIFLLSGFSRGFSFVPQFFANQYFDASGKDSIKMRIWVTLASYGDVLAIAFMHIFLTIFHWNWKICLWIAIGTFLVFSLAFELSCKQITIKRLRSQNEMSEDHDDTVQEVFQEIKSFLQEGGNFLWLITLCLLTSLYYSMLLWLPYYFQKRGFDQEAGYISLTIPAVLPIGATFMSFLLEKIPGKHNLFANTFLIIQAVAFLVLLLMSPQIQSAGVFAALLIVIGIFISGPWSYFYTTEMHQRARGVRAIYHALLLSISVYQMFIVLEMVAIGYLTEKKLESLWFFFLLLSIAALLLNLLRNHFYPLRPESQQLPQDGENLNQ